MADYRNLVRLLLLICSIFTSSRAAASSNSSSVLPTSCRCRNSTRFRNVNILYPLPNSSSVSGLLNTSTSTSLLVQPSGTNIDSHVSSLDTGLSDILAEANINSSSTLLMTFPSATTTFSGLPEASAVASSSQPLTLELVNGSASLNTSTTRDSWETSTLRPFFANFFGIPKDTSNAVSAAILLHNSRNNVDLYPTTSNVKIIRACLSHKPGGQSGCPTAKDLSRRQTSNETDLHTPVQFASAIRDGEFFEFTEENIRDSGVIEWYARWTVEARDKYSEKFTSLGEWRMFYRWWLQEYDFRCGHDFAACLNSKTREDIQRMYPGKENRDMGRRVYFITLMYEYLHQHTRMMEDTYKELHEDLTGHISELISSFTQHADPHGMHLCEIYKDVINGVVSASLQLLGTVAGGIANPYTGPGQVLAVLTPQVGPMIGKWQQQISFGIYSWGQGQLQSFTIGYWATFQHLVEDRIQREQPIILSGMARGWGGLCASVEGDFQDSAALNENLLVTHLSGTFENIREFTRNMTTAIYTGNIIPQPGNPSLMAAIISHRKWAGENSIVAEMEDSRAVKKFIRRAIMKQVISKLISQSNNYMKCTHDNKAPSMCAAATTARNLGAKGSMVDKSRFCPHPETDPTYICQVNGWYFADDHQHERKMAGLDAVYAFWENEFNFTLDEMMGEAHTNFESCANNCSQTNMAGLGFSGDYETVRGFTLPVCRSDNNKISDFSKRGSRRYHFPSTCGDWRSNETEGFMNALNMGPGSEAFKTQSIDQLWRDRIPRELEGLRPLNYYLAFCKHKMQFPERWKWETTFDKLHNLKNAFNHFQIAHHKKPCKECEWVDKNIKDMEEMEANHFFCQSRYVWDNILTKQASHIDMTVAPTKRFENLETKCTKWMKKYGGKAPYGTRFPWQVDVTDAAKLVWNNFWRGLPITTPFSIKDAVEMAKDIGYD